VSTQRVTEILELSRTNDGNGVRSSTYATDYIYQGKCYSFSQRFTVPAATNLIIVFDISATDREISLYTPVLAATTGPINIDYYMGSDYTGGTACLVNNRAAYGSASQVSVKQGATGSEKGTLFSQDMVLSAHKSAGTSIEGLEFVPMQDSNILMELDNTNGTDATVLIKFVWFEV